MQRAGCPFFPCVADQIFSHESAVPKAYCDVAAVASDQLPTFNFDELQEAQKNDVCTGEVWHAVSLKKPASSILT